MKLTQEHLNKLKEGRKQSSSVFQNIPNSFQKFGDNFKLIQFKLSGNICYTVYERINKDSSKMIWEIMVFKRIEKNWKAPTSSQWGKLGWSFLDYSKCFKFFELLINFKEDNCFPKKQYKKEGSIYSLLNSIQINKTTILTIYERNIEKYEVSVFKYGTFDWVLTDCFTFGSLSLANLEFSALKSKLEKSKIGG